MRNSDQNVAMKYVYPFQIFLHWAHIILCPPFLKHTRRIGEGDFSPILLAWKYKDEFTKLAEAFNHMIKELDHKHNLNPIFFIKN